MIILYSSEKKKTKNTPPSVFEPYRQTHLILHENNLTGVLPRVDNEFGIRFPRLREGTCFERTC